MTIEEFTNTVCSKKQLLSGEAREIAQTIISTMRVAELEKQQLTFKRNILSELTGLFYIQADILVIRSVHSMAMITPTETMKAVNNKDSNQAA